MKRFRVSMSTDVNAERLIESPNGKWVRQEDAAELEQQVATLTAENAAMTRDKENLIQQAEQWAQEARTQRSIVLEIGGLVGCDKDFEMVSAVRDYIIAMEQRLKAQLAAAEAAGREHKWSGATYDNCVNCGQSAEYADIICPSPDAPPQHAAPIDMVLFCPRCHAQHIDAPETHREMVEGVHVGNVTLWDNPPHRSHLCAECGCVWRPADVATNGVAAIKTAGKVDTPVTEQHTARVPEWQPIETAPKDGARIWVINPVMDNPVIAAWGDYTTLSGIKTKAFVVTHDPHERFMPTTGNMVCPNRWLPLPATPAPKSEEG